MGGKAFGLMVMRVFSLNVLTILHTVDRIQHMLGSFGRIILASAHYNSSLKS